MLVLHGPCVACESVNSGAWQLKPMLTGTGLCRDEDRGFQLYHSDPSGNYGGWKATAIGQNHQAAQNIMKQDYKEDMDLQAAMQLVIKACSEFVHLGPAHCR